jgi:hypothetical protein
MSGAAEAGLARPAMPPEVQAVFDLARQVVHPYPHAADLDHWAKFPKWTAAQAAALSLGIDPDRFDLVTLHRPRQIGSASFKAVKLAKDRATLVDQSFPLPHRPITPENFVQWAITKEIPLHPDLQPAVERHGRPIESLQAALAVALAERNQAQNERDTLAQKLGEDFRGSEKSTMQMIIAAMAIHAYRHMPLPKRSSTAGDIVAVFERLGMANRHEDTVRDTINAAISAHVEPSAHSNFRHYLRPKTTPSERD